jgi:hypothetical protein
MMEPLNNFIRAAITADTHDASSLKNNWTRFAHTTNDALETRYYELVARYAPKFIPPTVPSMLPQLIGIGIPQTTSIPTTSESVLRELTLQLRDEQRTSKPYHRLELNTLFAIAGVERPWTGLTEAALPEFWQELKEFRKSTANVRLFVESYRLSHYPEHRFMHPFLFTPQLIKDLKGLSFTGTDPLIEYKNCHTGISIFSLAPLSEFGTDLGAHKRFLHYKETKHRHMPSDRATMESLSIVLQAFPSDRMSLYHWVDSFHIGMLIFFGSECPILLPIFDLLALLQSPVNTTGFTTTDF